MAHPVVPAEGHTRLNSRGPFWARWARRWGLQGKTMPGGLIPKSAPTTVVPSFVFPSDAHIPRSAHFGTGGRARTPSLPPLGPSGAALFVFVINNVGGFWETDHRTILAQGSTLRERGKLPPRNFQRVFSTLNTARRRSPLPFPRR